MREKHRILALAAGLLLAGQTGVYAFKGTFTTGKNWVERMSPGEKFMSLFVPAALLHSYNVPLSHSAEAYISAIDGILSYNPQLEKEDVANIFASAVYKYEPGCRPALKSLEMQFLRGNTRSAPHLVIQSDNET